jgi:L-arabinose isomerase
MAGIDFLLIDENPKINEFRDKLRWNGQYYSLGKGL